MKILGVETSCDETAISVIEVNRNSVIVRSNIVSSQVKLHAKYGGVVPNLAAREHVKNIKHVFKAALKRAGIKDFGKEIDLIAVTRGPGLGPALLIGISFARTLAWKYKKPLIGVNHLEGHVYSNWLPIAVNSKSQKPNYKQIPKSNNLKSKTFFPILNVIVSGGHTELVLMTNYGKYELLGETLDDAIGEAFDKVARLLGLGYPGGPAISRRAEIWKSQIPTTKSQINSKFQIPNSKFGLEIKFPRPMEHTKDYNFSYSGLKTSVLYKIRDLKEAGTPLSENLINEICHEFQNAATEVIVKKAIKAAKNFKAKSLFLSGGVSANKSLREELKKQAELNKLNYSQPELEYTGDNAAMIALAGYINYLEIEKSTAIPGFAREPSTRKLKIKTDWESVDMDANLGFKSE